jgi:hypothetical protein
MSSFEFEKDRIEEAIQRVRIVLLGLSIGEITQQLAQILISKNAKFLDIYLDELDDGQKLRDYFVMKHNRKNLPLVFVNGELIENSSLDYILTPKILSSPWAWDLNDNSVSWNDNSSTANNNDSWKPNPKKDGDDDWQKIWDDIKVDGRRKNDNFPYYPDNGGGGYKPYNPYNPGRGGNDCWSGG